MPTGLNLRAIVAISLSLLSLASFAQIELNLSNLPNKELQPGSTQTVVLNIANRGNDTANLKLDFKIPKPLRALIFNKKATVYPGKTKNILVPISIPRATGSGEYKLNFSVLKKSSVVAKQSVTFHVAKITDVKVSLIGKPEYARTTDTIQARFMIMNNGNAKEMLTLRSNNGSIKQGSIIHIPPDSTMFIDLIILNDPETYEIEDQLIDLFAEIGGLQQSVGDQEIIKVYPIKTKKIDPFFRLPITANFNYFTQNTNGEYRNSVFQFQISGRGAIDVDKKHRVSFSYRGPGAVRIARLGNFSQKYFTYSNDNTTLFIGEKTFGLSELTENFRFGTGVEVKTVFDKKLATGMYYNRPIFQPEIAQQVAGHISYTAKGRFTYRINSMMNYLRTGEAVNLTSFQTNLTNFNDWRFSAELSRSFGGTDNGNAASYNANFSKGKFKLASNALYADKNFKGYYNNSLFVGLNTSYNWKKIGVVINSNYNDANPNLDTVYSTAPISFFLSTGLISRIGNNLNVQVHGLYREKTDRLSNKSFDYNEQRVRLTMNYKRGNFSSRIMSEAGNTINNLQATPITAFGYDVQLQVSYRPKQNISLNSFSQYLVNNRFTNEQSQFVLYGFDASYNFRKKLDIGVEYQNNYLIEDLYNDRNLFNFRLGYDITPMQSINLLANYGILHQIPVRREWFLSGNYIMRFGVPLKRITELGSLKGQLINGGVKSVDNVVLMLDGQLITTDKDGYFTFNNVRPGRHQLFIDRSTIGVRDLPDQRLPIEVDIYPERESTIEIKMTLSAKVTGKINLIKTQRMVQSSKQEVAFPSIIVEASNGEDKLLTRADGEGNFVFGSLRPGNWTIRMIPTYWKDEFVLKKPYVTLDLTAGQEEEVTLEISPKVRQIRFLNKKTIKVGGK
jgi:hypothetical protein